jgi:cellulose synthase/poly-beta-1,6-N-acetylglucosamine synthase-like glycosyltransferase
MTTAELDTQLPPPTGSFTVDVEIVVPAYNEQDGLARTVNRLHEFLLTQFPFTAVITIADNASTDSTWAIARRLEEELPFVRATHLDAKGRGRALHDTWSVSTARVVAYMDVDLSTDLSALLPLVAPLMSGTVMWRSAAGSAARRGWCADRDASSSPVATT